MLIKKKQDLVDQLVKTIKYEIALEHPLISPEFIEALCRQHLVDELENVKNSLHECSEWYEDFVVQIKKAIQFDPIDSVWVTLWEYETPLAVGTKTEAECIQEILNNDPPRKQALEQVIDRYSQKYDIKMALSKSAQNVFNFNGKFQNGSSLAFVEEGKSSTTFELCLTIRKL